jgi:hypothetical protein
MEGNTIHYCKRREVSRRLALKVPGSLILEGKSRKVIFAFERRVNLLLKISKSLQQHNHSTMADYKSYLAASILTEDKVVSQPTRKSIITATNNTHRLLIASSAEL